MNPERLFSVDINLVLCLAAAWLIELALGSPRFMPKLSLLVARFVKKSADRVLAMTDRLNKRSASIEKCAGAFLLLYLVLFSFILTAVLTDLARRLHPSFYYMLNVLIICRIFNTRAAADSAAAARKKLRGESSEGIRHIIADISKNCLDGVFAPMIYASLGVLLGIPAALAAAYKTLSILDRVIGHKTGEYCNLGWATAKTDNIANFIPARLSGVVLPLLAPFCGTGARGIAHGFRATRETHAARMFSNNFVSPNDAWPAAAFAGTLGIRLGAAGVTGKENEPDDFMREPEISDIGIANRLMIASSLAALLICCVALIL